jgi:hypothetical protein
MPKGLNVHAAERVDLEDFVYGSYTFPKGEQNLANAKNLLDNQSRILHGFRVEIPDQTIYPGRIVVHGGYALNTNGQRLYNEDYLTVSRTTTLEGAGVTFWVEVEFIEVDADSDARAFWDPTVVPSPATDPSGDSRPLGQEFGDTVATRKALDWRIVTPIRTGSGTKFERDITPTSNKIPIIVLQTDSTGQIGAATEKAATVILEVVSLTPGKLRVQDAQHFLVGDIVVSENSAVSGPVGSTSISTGPCKLTDTGFVFSALYIGQPITIAGATNVLNNGTFTITGVPAANEVTYNNGAVVAESPFTGTWSISLQETKTIASTDVATGVITLSGNLVDIHLIGDIVRNSGLTTPNFAIQSTINRYGRAATPAPGTDCEDRFFQGDEVHGDVLSRNTSFITSRSDLSLKNLKDYVDFLSAQIEELKWGNASPAVSSLDPSRVPPGIKVNFPTVPRYYDKVGGIQGARTASVTIGDGTTSWGDFSGGTGSVLQAAIDSLPADGGTIYVKRGSYVLAIDVTINKHVELICDDAAVFVSNGGWIVVNTSKSVILKGLKIRNGTSNYGLKLSAVGANPNVFVMDECLFTNVQFSIETNQDTNSTFIQKCVFRANHSSMISKPLVVRTLTNSASGFWSDCSFYHLTAASLDGACWKLASVDQVFHNCTFTTVNASCTSSINFDSSSGNINILFHCCKFGDATIPSNVAVEVKAELATNVKFIGCRSRRPSSLIYAKTSYDLVVDNCTIDLVTSVPAIISTNCSNVIITNNIFKDVRGDSISVSGCPISFISNSSGQTANVTIAKNYIIATLDKVTGMKFESDVSADSVPFTDININGNIFDKCELGMYFVGTVTKQLRRFNIESNVFKDDSSSFQKIGIYGVSDPIYLNWTLKNNKFSNLDPNNNSVVVAGPPLRSAIAILGQKQIFEMDSNVAYGIGRGGVNSANITAFYIPSIIHGCVTNNKVIGVYSTNGVVGDAVGFNFGNMSNTEINNNIVSDIEGFLLVRAFITGMINESSLNNNIVKYITVDATGSAHMFYYNDSITGFIRNAEFNSNVLYSTSDRVTFLKIIVLNIANLHINDNIASDTLLNGCYVEAVAGGAAKNVHIINNTIDGHTGNGIIVIGIGSSFINKLSIKNNTIAGGGGYNINAYGFTFGIFNENDVYQSSANVHGMLFEQGTDFQCCNNVSKHIGGGTGCNIYIDDPCNRYSVNDNTFRGAALRSIKSVSVNGTAPPAQGMVHDNLVPAAAGIDVAAHGDDLSGNLTAVP